MSFSARIIRRRDEQAEREFKDLTSRINWILSIPELADPLFQRWFKKETPHGGTGQSERAVLVCSGDTMTILIPENEDADFFHMLECEQKWTPCKQKWTGRPEV